MLEMFKKSLIGLILLILNSATGVAQSGHKLEINLENYPSSEPQVSIWLFYYQKMNLCRLL